MLYEQGCDQINLWESRGGRKVNSSLSELEERERIEQEGPQAPKACMKTNWLLTQDR